MAKSAKKRGGYGAIGNGGRASGYVTQGGVKDL